MRLATIVMHRLLFKIFYPSIRKGLAITYRPKTPWNDEAPLPPSTEIQDLWSWVQMKMQPPAEKIETVDAAAKLVENNDIVVIGFFKVHPTHSFGLHFLFSVLGLLSWEEHNNFYSLALITQEN